jgi:hypothetical protein
MTVSVKASYLVRVLTIIAVILILASIGGQISKYEFGHDYLKGLVPMFYLDEENNIPTFFTVILMLFISLLLSLIANINYKLGIRHTAKWVILSIGFLCMAFDEGFAIHENLISPFRGLMGDINLGIFYYAWVVPGIILVLFLGAFFTKFLLQLPVATRSRFLVAAGIYLAGAIGVELIGGQYAEIHGINNPTYSFIVTIEESLEIIGLILFISSLINHCSGYCKELRLIFEP